MSCSISVAARELRRAPIRAIAWRVIPIVVVVSVAVLAVLVSEARDKRTAVWIAKPIASTGFVVAALLDGLPSSAYGRSVVVALLLSWFGDVLLIPRSQRVFLLGILAFLSAHIAYAGAFVVHGIVWSWALAAAALLAIVGAAMGRYFVAHAPTRLKGAVVAYVAVLSAMVALAIGAYGHGRALLIPIAAIAFYFSDVSVALNRFVRPSALHRAWGLPLYYAAQLLFAATAR
jgi:uncharacterized membrane protein YhhN